MIEVEIHKTGLVFSLPEKIEEVTPAMAEIIGDMIWQEIEPIEKAVLFFTKVAKLKYLQSDKNIDWELLGAQIIQHELISSLLFLFDEKNTISFFPTIQVDKISLIGPLKEMENMRVLEWVKADELLEEWMSSKDEFVLNQLCGVLYRKKGIGKFHDKTSVEYKGDEREKFNPHITDYYENYGSLITPGIKKLIAWQYYCSRKWLITEFDELHDGASEGDTTVSEMMLGLAGDTFGSLAEVQDSFVIDIMVYLTKQLRDAEKLTIKT